MSRHARPPLLKAGDISSKINGTISPCAGGWLPDIISAAGRIEVTGKAGCDPMEIECSTLGDEDLSDIVFAPCSFNLKRACKDPKLLNSRSGWQKLRAVKTGEVYVVDGNQFFSRPGPRVVESLGIVAEMLHPKIFSFGHYGTIGSEAHNPPFLEVLQPQTLWQYNDTHFSFSDNHRAYDHKSVHTARSICQ